MHMQTNMRMAGGLNLHLKRGAATRAGTAARRQAPVQAGSHSDRGAPSGGAFKLMSAFQLKSGRSLSQTLEPQFRSCATLAGACQTYSQAWYPSTRHSFCSQVLCLPGVPLVLQEYSP